MECQNKNCNQESTMEITNQYTNGQVTIMHYCTKHGKPIYQKLFREMYGLPPKT